MVVVSDGRDTSSVSSLSEAVSMANDLQCRIITVGYGENVATANLRQLSEETGGHFYAAPTDDDLRAILKGAVGAGILTTDLANQLILTYISLATGDGTYLIELELDGNTGSFQRDATVFPGDTRAGQISLQSDPVANGSTELTIRTEYAPRAMSQLRFRFFLPGGASISSVDFAPDGLLANSGWIIVSEGGDTFTAITSQDNAIPFAAFGELFRVRLNGVAPGDDIGFRLDNRIYVDPPFTVYFAYPDELTLGADASFEGPIVLGNDGLFNPADPYGLGEGFNPDATLAFDRDEDLTPDFDDADPDDDTIQ